MTIDAFLRRMRDQEGLELLAWDTYVKAAAELKDGSYKDLFLEIAKQEERHAELVREVLELLK